MAASRTHLVRRLVVSALAIATLAGQLLQAERSPRAPVFALTLRDARVIAVDSGGAADRAGLRAGDVIEQVAGVEILPGGRALPLLDRFAAGDLVTLTVRRGHELVFVELPLSPAGPRDVAWRLTLAAVGILMLLIGLLVYWKKPRDLTLIFAGICYGLGILIHPPTALASDWLHRLGEGLLAAMTFLVPPLFVHFFLRFPMRRTWLEWRGRALLLYLPSLLLLALLWISRSVVLSAAPARRLLADIAQTGAVALWFAGIGGAIALFIDSYRRARTATARRQIRVVLWATILGALPVVLVLPVRQIWPQQPFDIDRLAVLLTTLIPIGFGYALVRHGVFDATMIVRRSFALTALSGALFLAFLAVTLCLRALFRDHPNGPPVWLSIASTGTVAMLFLPAQQRIRGFLSSLTPDQSADERYLLHEFGEALRQATDRPAVIRATTEFMAEALGVERVAFCEIDDQDRLEAVYLYGVRPDDLGCHRFSPSLSRRMLAVPRPIERGELETDLPYGYLSPTDLAALSLLDVEVLVPVRAVVAGTAGVILAGRRTLGDPLPKQAMRLAATLAGETSRALENVILLARARAESQLRDEVRDARDLQQRLLPEQMPQVESLEISGFSIPCEAVGGDYYDCFRTPWGEIVFAIGDVCGKGVPGALLMANLNGLVKTEASRREPVAHTVERINRRFCEMRRPERFVTFCLTRIDPLTGHIAYSSAGHSGAAIARASGAIEEMSVGGVPLGIDPQATYSEGRLSLRAGDIMLLYTDGITERRNGDDEYGAERLHALVSQGRRRSARALQEAILAGVRAYGSGPLEDDTTLLVVKVL